MKVSIVYVDCYRQVPLFTITSRIRNRTKKGIVMRTTCACGRARVMCEGLKKEMAAIMMKYPRKSSSVEY